MRRVVLLLSLCLLSLAATAAATAQPLTRMERIHGKDQRGKYEIEWLQLTERAARSAVRARVNTDLEKEARSRICAPTDGEHLQAEFGMKETYLSPHLLGVSYFEFITCGGPNPTHGTRGLMYDLRTGARLELEREMASQRAFRRFVDRRVLAAQPRDAPDCADVYKQAEWGYIYILNARTLSVTQDYPNVVKACAYTTDIPHADLIPFVKPSSPLRTLGR